MEKLEKDMTPRLIGETYMKYPNEKSSRKYRYGLFECQYCGKEFETNIQSVKCGDTKSCGCQHHKPREKSIKHGLRTNKFYQTWYGMLQRCTNTMRQDYKNYGARGITVCGEWLDIRNFVAWCDLTYPNIEDATLDRIDNDKGYSPDNCRWADRATQAINQRRMKNNASGYVGVSWDKSKDKWTANIGVNGKQIRIGVFKDKMDAVQARDNYIIENNLPHKLSIDCK